jgi:hypothetical protein
MKVKDVTKEELKLMYKTLAPEEYNSGYVLFKYL